MGVDINKIEKFYVTDIGCYAREAISNLLQKHIRSGGGECVVSPGACFYKDFIRQYFDFVVSHTDENQSENEYSIAWRRTSKTADSVIMIHDVEFSKAPDNHLKEAHRVLKGDGRLIVVFPNRSGGWARRDNTPFGVGQPRTLDQMKSILQDNRFKILDSEGALFYPPLEPKVKMIQSLMNQTHGFGLYPAGIYMVVAQKKEIAGTKIPVSEKIGDAVRGVIQPDPKPVGTPMSRKNSL